MKATLAALLGALILVLACLGVAFFITVFLSPLFVTGRSLALPWGRVQADYWRILGYLTLPGVSGPLHLRWLPVDGKVVRHFADVRRLIQGGLLITIVNLGLAGGLVRGLLKKWQAWRLVWLLPRVMSFLVVIGGLVAVNFNDAFLWFHHQVFTNLDWVFSPQKEPLIKLWPPSFFLALALLWGCLTEGLLWLVLLGLQHRLGLFLPPAPHKANHRRN